MTTDEEEAPSEISARVQSDASGEEVENANQVSAFSRSDRAIWHTFYDRV